jgi:hypothetical protein
MAAHIHAELMLQYAKDAQLTNEPWTLWEYRLAKHDFTDAITSEWMSLQDSPTWRIEMEYRHKPKWEPKEGNWRNFFNISRDSEEEVKIAIREINRFTRLLALAHELNNDNNCPNYFLHYDCYDDKWEPHMIVNKQYIVTPLFTRDAAFTACKMLNSNEAKL